MVKVKEKSELVTVDAGKNLEKLKAKQFLKPKIYSILLPYFDELESEVDKNFQKILNGLIAAFLSENHLETTDYYDMLEKHLHHFGLRISKAYFLNLTRFFYEIIIKENQLIGLLRYACGALSKMAELVKVGTFGWRDLKLDWRPLYDLYLRAFNGKMEPSPKESLNKVLYVFAWFYDPSEHAAIWETILQEFSVGNQFQMDKFVTICWNFLSTIGLSVDEIKKYAVNTWIKEIWKMYLDAEMNASWTFICIDYLSEIASFSPEAIDMRPYYDVLFTKTMRSFNLTVREGKVSVGDWQEVSIMSHLAHLCAYTIGGPYSSLEHFKRLMRYIQFNVHPMNSGDHIDQISEFLLYFLTIFKVRIKEERLCERKRKCSKEHYLSDRDIDETTQAMTEICLMLMFGGNRENDYKVIYMLTAINREYVAPKMLDHLYSSLSAISEPSRFTIVIESFYMVIFEIIRQPDPEYRTPRHVIYDSTWLRKLEEERKDWPTHQPGSEVPQIHEHKLISLRAHAFYIMEIFINHIDVNDVDRTTLILKTLITLFSSFPLMDFSTAIQYHGKSMNEDDRLVCLLSRRVPYFVEFVLKKLLSTVTCLSVCPPKASDGAAGLSMSSESQQQEGDEEAALKSGISQIVTVMFERVGEQLRARLFDILFAYLTTVEFSSFLATELLSAIIGAATWMSSSAFRRFAEFVDKKLKNLLTDDVQKSKIVSSSVLFHVLLARAVYSAPHDIILENEKVLCDITELLLKCHAKAIFKIGTVGVRVLINTLSSICTEATASPDNETFKRPLNEWNPIKEWAKCTHYKNLIIRWYIPALPEMKCAQRIANRFLFPYIEKLKSGESLDRETLRNYTFHVMSVIEDIDLFKHPESLQFVSDIYTPHQLPLPPSSLGNSCRLEYELKGPNGENSRELLVAMVEAMTGHVQDPTTLTDLAIIAYICLGKRQNMYMNNDIEKSLPDVHRILMDSTYCRIVKASQHTMDELAFYRHSHVVAYHKCEIQAPNDFDQRILTVLTELAMNDYEKVQNCARMYLKLNLTQLLRCRDMIIPKIVQVLTDQTSNNKDRLNGAIGLMLSINLLDSINPKIRLIIWDACLRIKTMDDALVCQMFECIHKTINKIDRDPIFRKEASLLSIEQDKNCARLGALIAKNPEPFLTPESIEKQRQSWRQFENSRHTLRAHLVEQLFAMHIRNKALHHTREKLARSMVYNCQREAADEKTIRLLLTQLYDEEYDQRKEARSWLAYWLWKNKPKTVKVKFTPPKRVAHGVALESGIREDNIWLAYDSKNLPDTEAKWNSMTFVEKEFGSCRWPNTLLVTRKRKDGPPLETKMLSAADNAIIDFFSNPASCALFFEHRVLEKEEFPSLGRAIFKIVKLVIRNYPNATMPLQMFTETLKKTLNSKDRKEKLMAAELFLGIVQGLKHRTFVEQNAFWTEMTPRLNEFFNVMDEAEDAWTVAIKSVLYQDSDLRRLWWFIESLITGVKKTTTTNDVVQAFRLRCLLFRRWRYGEIVKRVVAIAWSKLPFSITDSLRNAIACVLRSSTLVRETNATASLVNVDSRFYPETLDETMRKFIEQIPMLKVDNEGTVKSSRSDPTLTSFRERETGRRRSSSPAMSENKMSNIYLRTLLEYILQYYENSTHSWTPALLNALPKLMEFANEDVYDLSEETCKNVDISQNAAFLIHDYMSGSWLAEQHAQDIVKAWHTTFKSKTWRVRLAVVKFIQASVYSNMFSMCAESRRESVQKLLFEALFDENVTVRKETSKCLLLFVHCGYITISSQKVEELSTILATESTQEVRVHGAVLGLGALCLAHPFSLPLEILKPLGVLNTCRSSRALIKNEITMILREFRRQHRDDWEKTKKVLGAKLSFDIENSTAPAYYA